MSAAPFLAAWIAHAFPGLAARDLGLPAGYLLPWLPGVRAGLADAAMPAAEQALLARFRQRGRPLLGLDPIADSVPDPAWEAAPERLAWCDTPGAAGDASLTLLHGGLGAAPVPAGMARIMLLAGSTTAVERHDLLLPEPRLAEVFGRLRAAAAALAGPGWQVGGRLVSPQLASLGALAPDPGGPVPELALPAAGLPHDLPGPGLPGGEGLPLAGAARVRVLVGALPARPLHLRLGFAGAEPGAVAFFLDGLRHPARVEQGGWLAAEVTPHAGRALVLGLAWPGGAPAGLRLDRVEARA